MRVYIPSTLPHTMNICPEVLRQRPSPNSFFWDNNPATAYSFVLLQVVSPEFSLLLSCKPKNGFERNFKAPVGKRFPFLSWLLPRLVAYL